MNNSNIRYDLVSRKTIKKMDKIFRDVPENHPSWESNVLLFYNDYIKPNLFPIIILLFFALFLGIRYCLKQEKQAKQKKKKDLKKSKKIENSYVIDYGDSQQEMENNDVYQQQPHQQQYEYNSNDDNTEYRNDDEISFYTLNKAYEQALINNRGYVSDQMIKEMKEKDSSKLAFNELARMVGSD